MATSSSNPWVVIHIFRNSNKSALIWSLLTQRSRRLEADQIATTNIDLGYWLDLNPENDEFTKTDFTCDVRVVDGFLQIRVPVVFFSSTKLSNPLGFSPGLGRVGCFSKEITFEKNQIYMAWITYKKYCTQTDMQCQIKKYNLEWVLEPQPVLHILKTELKAILQTDSFMGMRSVNGVVVEKNIETSTGCIYNPEYGVCEYQLSQKTSFNVGCFVQFIAIQNFFGWMTALNISPIASPAKGISVFSTEPELKLSISAWKYNVEKRVIDVPSWGLVINLAYTLSKSSEEPKQYDYSQPLTAVFDYEVERFTLPHGLPMIRDEKKAEEVLSEVEDHVNFFTSLKIDSKPANENRSKPQKRDMNTSEQEVRKENCQEKSAVPSNFGRTEHLETDAVIVYSSITNVILYTLKTDSAVRKFSMPKSRFKEELRMGEWFRVSIPDCEIIERLGKPVLKTEVLNSQLIKLYTRIKVVEAFVNEDDPNEVCGYSEDLGAVIDNQYCLKKNQMGKEIDLWVLTTSPTNGAHWRIFAEKSRPTDNKSKRNYPNTSMRRPGSPKNLLQSSSEQKKSEELNDVTEPSLSEVERGSPGCLYDVLKSEEKIVKRSRTKLTEKKSPGFQSDHVELEVEAQIIELDHKNKKVGIRISGNNAFKSILYVQKSMFTKTPAIGVLLSVTVRRDSNGTHCLKVRLLKEDVTESNAENKAASAERNMTDDESANKSISSDHDEGVELDAIVTFVGSTHVFFYAVQSKLTNPTIKVSMDEFTDSEKPRMGVWFHLIMDSERNYRKISGYPLLNDVLKTRVDGGKYLMVKTKVHVRRLPKVPLTGSSICGYSDYLGPILDNTEWLRPYQANRTIEVWVQHCNQKDGASWCIFNQRYKRTISMA